MSHCNNQTSITQAVTSRKRQFHSPWFWFLFAGGSVLLHLALIDLVESLSHRSLGQSTSNAILPIDWVELPAAVSSPSTASVPSISAATAPTAGSPPSSKAAQVSSKADLSGIISDDIAAIGSLPIRENDEPKQINAEFVAAAVSAPPANSPESANLSEPVKIEPDGKVESAPSAVSPVEAVEAAESEVDQPSPTLTSASEAELQESQLQESQPLEPQLEIEERPIPLPPPSPLIATQPIDVPLPDVTEMLPIESNENGATVTEQIAVPSELTASLTTALPEATHSPLDEAAYPKQEVQTFAANSISSPCVMSPEAVPFLGKTVAMQVRTDESGQVVDTVTQESSQNTAYDELATCLVENWDFEPAIAQGQPVATDGLVVRITIEADG